MTYTCHARDAAVDAVVWLALSEPGGAYAETAAAIRTEFQLGGGLHGEVVVRPWRDLPERPAVAPRLIVAIGVGAFRGMLESGTKAPLLAILVPRAAYQRIADTASRSGRAVSAVWLDQPVGRQLDLLRIAMPARHRVGVMLGPESRLLEQELARAAAERNFELKVARIEGNESLPRALQGMLDESDVLLALPDPQIYNGATVQNVLTAAYRHRVPLAGFSPAYVKAGAMLALYSTPAQVGAQAGEIARAVIGGRPLPAALGPRLFSVGVNTDVARSLGIAIDEDAPARWTERLRREATP